MRPAAHVAAAITVLDKIVAGVSAETALATWARGARYAGSADRAAVRDHVFDVLRRWRSCALRGGGDTGRALMLGLLRERGIAPEEIFTGLGHAPAPLDQAERQVPEVPQDADLHDLPDWLWPRFEAALGPEAQSAVRVLRQRAPITLRVNLRRVTRDDMIARLAAVDVSTQPVPDVDSALRVIHGDRRIAQSAPFLEGLLEFQDASCQAAMARLDAPDRRRVLDYCAGAGGKTLALAARGDGDWFAHDVAARRLANLTGRAMRAGIEVHLLEANEIAQAAPFDVVLCDVPCSGSGTWRRNPEAKWSLTPERLDELASLQVEILGQAAAHVAPGGRLAYATCSVFCEENRDVVRNFLRCHPGWSCEQDVIWPISEDGDGFYLATLTR